MLKNILSSLKKIKKASKYADCKNSGKGSLLKYYGVKTERRGLLLSVWSLGWEGAMIMDLPLKFQKNRVY